ncbi:hypothetical protein [Nocardia terpenica]|uniref:Uncharacterized protein n=1 Tax=Nocardia terpenica TaxID=455432 RepID=A0A6G9ZDR9_9NOCA|nr:hypothetical protein [Nocardia terpenica]QIS23551.1 hypothetical protein F6W96_39990 [Nocardia terpenica]
MPEKAETVAPVDDPAPAAVVVDKSPATAPPVAAYVPVASGATARDIVRERMRACREAPTIPPCPTCGNLPTEGHAQLQ